MKKTLDHNALMHFTGTENWYRHNLCRNILFTDGAKYVADTAGAYWLIDEIAFAQRASKAVTAEAFQTWELRVNVDESARLICTDGNGNEVFTKAISWTDFPAEGITLWLEHDGKNGVILLPSEH